MSTLYAPNCQDDRSCNAFAKASLLNRFPAIQERAQPRWRRTKDGQHFFLALIPVMLLLITPSCNHRIKEFAVRPLQVCGESPVTLKWITKGETTTISANHAVAPPLTNVDNTGEMIISINQTTTFTIESKELNQTERARVTVKLFPAEGGLVSIGGPTLCELGSWKYTEFLEPNEWDELIRVDTVRNMSGQPIRVMHAGAKTALDVREATDSFSGAAVSGSWFLTTPLRDGEDCSGSGVMKNPGPRRVSPYLGIEISASCQYP